MSTQTALITGASRGLGLALARELAQQNWRLIINARGADALEGARKELSKWTEVTAIAGDVTDAEHRKALTHAAKELGGLDAAINNAGILGPSPQPELLNYPLDILADVYRANVIAHLWVCSKCTTTHIKNRCPRNQHHQRCRSRSVPRLGRIRLFQSRA